MVVLGLAALSLVGCVSFDLQATPARYSELGRVRQGSGAVDQRLRGPDGVEVRILTGYNPMRETLAEAARMALWHIPDGYELEAQSPIVSSAGVAGTRFDFGFAPLCPVGGSVRWPSRLIVFFFVTDRWTVTVSFLGEAEAIHEDDVQEILASLELHGCRARTGICSGAQPESLVIDGPSARELERCERRAAEQVEARQRPEAEAVCARVAASVGLDEAPASFMTQCRASFELWVAELGPEAALAYGECVMESSDIEALRRCTEFPSGRAPACERLAEVVVRAGVAPDSGPSMDELRRDCHEALDRVQRELGTSVEQTTLACLREATTPAELDACRR